MELKMHQKAKTAEQSKSGDFKFQWDSKKKKKKKHFIAAFSCCLNKTNSWKYRETIKNFLFMVKQALECNYTTSTILPNWFRTNSCDKQTEIYKTCISHHSKAGARDINICAKMSRSSQIAATPGSFVVATDVLKDHLWWGESPCNGFLSGKEHWKTHERCSWEWKSSKCSGFLLWPVFVWHAWHYG